jgi:hypothetical protein
MENYLIKIKRFFFPPKYSTASGWDFGYPVHCFHDDPENKSRCCFCNKEILTFVLTKSPDHGEFVEKKVINSEYWDECSERPRK